MQDFTYSLASDAAHEELVCAVRGSGAFYRFKIAICYSCLEQEWYDFQYREYRKTAIDWHQQQKPEFTEGT